VLGKVDAEASTVSKEICDKWWTYTKQNADPIFFEFIEAERNNVLKVFELGAKEHRHTRWGWQDSGATYEELVRKYGEYKMLTWGEDERDASELLRFALEWWELELRTIEQAIIEGDVDIFQKSSTQRHNMLERSLSNRPMERY